MPPPLKIPPSRARRQFAARLAQRKAELEASNKEDGDEDDVATGGDSEKKESTDATERFSHLFEGIESSSEDDDEEEGSGGGGVATAEVEKGDNVVL
jgi:SIT4-associating protein SAP185/190